MKLPNGDRAVILMDKLLGYCLNPDHIRGKHKARVFKSVLGITADNVGQLEALVRQAALEGEIIQERETNFGQEFKLDWMIPGTDSVELRTIWIVPPHSIEPQLVSAFIN
jgi:hypothetical protein